VRGPRVGLSKVQCENCAAKNRQVRLVGLTLRSGGTRQLLLCEACAKIAAKPAKED
jgi:hypothetical protein